jgi:hypothetical protein
LRWAAFKAFSEREEGDGMKNEEGRMRKEE